MKTKIDWYKVMAIGIMVISLASSIIFILDIFRK